MDDKMIVELYFERSEAAIEETRKKYGKYCHKIAYNILYSDEDSEECVNDTYVKAWETMPPEKPLRLSAYLGRITRNIALNRYAHGHADKRNAHLTEVYDEAAEAIPSPEASVSDELILKEAINSFVASLEKDVRIIFVRRYWYMSPVKDIAKDYGLPEGTVKSILSRTRKRFKAHLEKEGIDL